MLGATPYIYSIFNHVATGLKTIAQWCLSFIDSIFQSDGALVELKPLFCIGIAVAIIFVAFILIRKVVWGN